MGIRMAELASHRIEMTDWHLIDHRLTRLVRMVACHLIRLVHLATYNLARLVHLVAYHLIRLIHLIRIAYSTRLIHLFAHRVGRIQVGGILKLIVWRVRLARVSVKTGRSNRVIWTELIGLIVLTK